MPGSLGIVSPNFVQNGSVFLKSGNVDREMPTRDGLVTFLFGYLQNAKTDKKACLQRLGNRLSKFGLNCD